jgi:hypothetical protein
VGGRLADVDPDDLELVWLLGQADAPLAADDLAQRTARWRPLGHAAVERWCADAAGRDLVMLLTPGGGAPRGERPTFALTAAGAGLAARLRGCADRDAQRLRALLLVGPATTGRLCEHEAWERLGWEEADDWLAFAAARGLVAGNDEHPPAWRLTAAGRKRAEAAGAG